MTLRTPEYPEGREIIVIGNDITIEIGTFGPKEDLLFFKASELARKLKIPRIYLAANSGARMGIAKEVLSVLKVAWEDESDPEKGFKYLYITPDDHMKLASSMGEVVHTQLVQDGIDNRYKITDIIGKANDIGVENLSAAGLIAGETSRAYKEIVTMSMTTSRAIGIGAYLVRLGQRVVQVENSAIILTGASALNKLLGREVYTSNTQLGGVQIMYQNGVTHKTERNDFDGVRRLLRWLSYIPKHKGFQLPILPSVDPIDRKITYRPPKTDTYDPRWLLTGKTDASGGQLTGFFDEGSFDEIMGGWARSVVTGRARLGGIPVGCIAVETRPTELNLPADPANPDSDAKVVSQAGQVWYPDSAYKTAQAMVDFNHEELPLIVFANWRGFSGGMMDMYEQVIKFGAQIVEALHSYNQPIIIYIPPHAELRGGSWVVIDPNINVKQMEMYADRDARGGVLEAEGIVSIKIRSTLQRSLMERLDTEMSSLAAKMQSTDLTKEAKMEVEEAMRKREEILAPIYHQVAVQFADLHDTPTRMLEKGVIRGIIPWEDARTVLYWRLRRRLLESQLIKKLKEPGGSRLTHGQSLEMLRRWFIEDLGENQRFLWEQDRPAVEWLQQQVDDVIADPASSGGQQSSVVLENLKILRRDAAVNELKSVLDQYPDLGHEAGMHLVQKMSVQKRADFLEAIKGIKESSECNGGVEGTGESAEEDSSDNGDTL
jgi:acetyl-CoA carboxylase/biotin carboxylase 1